MGTLTIKPGAELKAKIKDHYASHEVMTTSQYEENRFKMDGLSVVCYTSGKVLAQGRDELVEDFRLRFDSAHIPSPISDDVVALARPGQIGILGTDETGTGSYFGDVVVAAVFVKDKADLDFLQALGVDDSKVIKDDRIRVLAPKIMSRLTYEVVNCPNADYNRVIGTKHNANSIKVALHNHILLKMLKDRKLNPTRIIVDGFASKENWGKYVTREKRNAQDFTGRPIELLQKAEGQYLAVGAASIIARYEFLMSLERDSKLVDLELPSGAGSNVDKVGLKLVQAEGAQALDRYAKKHFKNTERVLKALED